MVIILDTPTLAHISPLISSFTESAFFAKFRSGSEDDGKAEYTVRVVFHLCGNSVLEDERYKMFMNGFAAGVHASFNLMLWPICYTYSERYSILSLRENMERIR